MPKLPKYEEWTPAWEKQGEEFSADKARKLIYDLLSDKERLSEKVTTITGERDAAQAKVTEIERKDMSEVDRLKAENAELKKPKADDLTLVRYELALEHGLTKTQAKRLVGGTREELEADVEALKTDLGGSKKPAEEHEERPDGGRQKRYTTGNQGGPGEVETDPAKLGDLIK